MREMSDESINAKHVRIRGSLDYKYPPVESACKAACGHGDDLRGRSHRCVLAIAHSGHCEWSSECVAMRRSSDVN